MKTKYLRQFDVRSFTSDRVYKVSERYDSKWECSCPAWKFHGDRQDCKHIRHVKQGMNMAQIVQQSFGAIEAPTVDLPSVRIGEYEIRRRRLEEMDADVVTVPMRSRRTFGD